MTRSHKDQHYVPRSYLAAWTDPDTPDGHTPYLNVISGDGSQMRQRAPSNVFTEKDMYTIKLPDGQRDLSLENGLAELEASFIRTRKEFLSHRKAIPQVPYLKLLAFVAALVARTPKMRDHHASQWETLVQRGEEMERVLAKHPEARKAFTGVTNKGKGIPLDVAREIAEKPMQHILLPFIEGQMVVLPSMSSAVLCTNDDIGFITSDAPVCWFDPVAHRYPPFYRSPGLGARTIEVTVPLSPSQLLVLMHGAAGPIQYVDVEVGVVTEMNRRTRFSANEEFVVRRGYVEARWFDAGTMPDDAWERTHPESGE